MRRNYFLTKYFNKKLSYGDQHRTSQYLKHWKDNQRLKQNSPFSQAHTQNLSFKVEHHCQTSFINPIFGLQSVTFHYNLMPNVNKMYDHPELLKQLALEVIDGILLDAAKTYIDGSKGKTNTTGSGVLLKPSGCVIKFQRRNTDHASVFRTELIAIMLSRERSCGQPCEGGYQQSCGSGRPQVLTSIEIYSSAKKLICRTWVVPPSHRFSTGHLRCMNFEGGKRSFPICPKCNISPFSPQNILQGLGFPVRKLLHPPAVLGLCTDL
ncbi:uncharacterized protein TNCV_370501 [Trichonephila clavipes]|nr:uncharacterized protein TNCV_370501 [Trichonephila clavipes]